MRFHGRIGYGESTETAPGVWEDVMVERLATGSVKRNTRKLQEDGYLNSSITVNNSISIVADAYASTHFYAMRYVEYAGTLWVVSDVEVERPRLILRLGGVYHGPTGTLAESP